jgi:D-alanyl-D-alanine carboxypeptidase
MELRSSRRALSLAAPWLRSLVLLCLIALPAQALPHELSRYAADWAERAGTSGSWRLERGAEVLAEGSRGFVHGTSGEPIGPDTVFWVGSIAKQFVAVASLKLVEQGKLELSAPLTRYLPELAPEAVSKNGVECTIEHTLSHRCGFARDLAGPFGFLGHLSDPEQEQALLAAVNDTRLELVPGSDFQYSNLGFDLMGLVVQRVSGQSYAAFLEQSFFGPLGMSHTGLALPADETLARGLTGAFLAWVDAATWLRFDATTRGEGGASGNVHSTPRDLLRWTRALHHGRVLEPATYAELIRPRSKDYALGTAVQTEVFGPMIWHNGAIGPNGYSSQLVYLPEHDVSVAVLSNLPRAVSQSQSFAEALLLKATGSADKEPDEPARPWSESSLFVLSVLLPPTFASLMMRVVRRKSELDAQSWWLAYHSLALALSLCLFAFGVDLAAPLLWLWALLVLGGAYKARWWTRPTWQRNGGWKVQLKLALRLLLFLALVLVIWRPVLWLLGAVLVAEALVILGEAFFAAKRRSQAVLTS